MYKRSVTVVAAALALMAAPTAAQTAVSEGYTSMDQLQGDTALCEAGIGDMSSGSGTRVEQMARNRGYSEARIMRLLMTCAAYSEGMLRGIQRMEQARGK